MKTEKSETIAPRRLWFALVSLGLLIAASCGNLLARRRRLPPRHRRTIPFLDLP